MQQFQGQYYINDPMTIPNISNSILLLFHHKSILFDLFYVFVSVFLNFIQTNTTLLIDDEVNDFINLTFWDISTTSAPIDNSSKDIIQHYALCDSVWQDSKHVATMSVLDVLALTQFVYEQTERYDLNDLVLYYFGVEYEVVARRDVEPVFFHMRHKEAAVDYISVRGTSSQNEMLQDISLFIEVTGFQLLSWVFPFLNALPTGFIRTIVSYASFAEGMINADARHAFGDVVEDYARRYLSEIDYRTSLYVVGHSLGGAVSQIVAAKLYESGDESDSYFASLGLNSPGTLYSSAKFGFEPSSLQLTSSSILSERDLVSAVDEHSGMIQEVACHAGDVFSCHLTQTPFCEMFSNCPNDTARIHSVINQYCNNEDYNYKLGAVMGVQNVSASNFNITFETPEQILINVTLGDSRRRLLKE